MTTYLFGQESRPVGFGLEIQPRVVSEIFTNSNLGKSSSLLGGAVSGNIFFDITPNYTLKTGLGLNIQRIDHKDYTFILPCDIGTQGVDSTNSWGQIQETITYMSIPISNRIAFSQNDNRFYLQIGAEALIRINNSGTFSLYECGTKTDVDISSSYSLSPALVTGNLGIGYEATLAGSGKIYVEPNVAYSFNTIFQKMSTDELINHSRLINIGIAAGIRFR
ncbi:MAG: outer membrane beta-barrel protein [Bacteroidia bacterium]